jgi:hypothetical protein
MAFQREYSAADALKIINKSEGLLVRNGIRRSPIDDENAAHGINRHLLRGAPGSLGLGVGGDAIRK